MLVLGSLKPRSRPAPNRTPFFFGGGRNFGLNRRSNVFSHWLGAAGERDMAMLTAFSHAIIAMVRNTILQITSTQIRWILKLH